MATINKKILLDVATRQSVYHFDNWVLTARNLSFEKKLASDQPDPICCLLYGFSLFLIFAIK